MFCLDNEIYLTIFFSCHSKYNEKSNFLQPLKTTSNICKVGHFKFKTYVFFSGRLKVCRLPIVRITTKLWSLFLVVAHLILRLTYSHKNLALITPLCAERERERRKEHKTSEASREVTCRYKWKKQMTWIT